MIFNKSTIVYASYLATKDGIQRYGSLKGRFSSYPPSFESVIGMQEIIKETYEFDEVLILGWQKLRDKELES